MSRLPVPTPALRAAYSKVFGDLSDPAVRDVLADLRLVCQAPEAPVVRFSDGSVDPNGSMRRVGQQEMFSRIRMAASIDDRALFGLSSPTLTEGK